MKAIQAKIIIIASGFLLAIEKVASIAVMIVFKFNSSFQLVLLPLECCTSIAEVKSANLLQFFLSLSLYITAKLASYNN